MKTAIVISAALFAAACSSVPQLPTVPSDAPEVVSVKSGTWLKSGEALPTRAMTREEYDVYLNPDGECDSHRNDPSSDCYQ